MHRPACEQNQGNRPIPHYLEQLRGWGFEDTVQVGRFLKTRFADFVVIPAQAGIQGFSSFLDSRLRGSDERIVMFSSPDQEGDHVRLPAL
jgi:hypothetical protein